MKQLPTTIKINSIIIPVGKFNSDELYTDGLAFALCAFFDSNTSVLDLFKKEKLLSLAEQCGRQEMSVQTKN